MNIANQLTILRILLVPVFMYFLLAGNMNLAAAIFIIASLTDFLDGYLARKMNLITNLGKFMDPLADKVLVMAAFICLVEIGSVSSWAVVIILGREFIVSIFRAVAAAEGIVIAASWWGKLKTNSQMLAIVLLLFNNTPFEVMNGQLAQIILWIAVALTVISGVDYIIKNKQVLKA
ncbi:CDP-diacylglycerol--glycerol-3-phosphate 3-phosphatidyltransferase [Fusibacter sp. JL216-2]|uniref:CDP-diacylglycerol--glycerol-3-phosphate 3-phosphatidyltransferase n=1 Tax=Fusibacter sp. JL216-2 TaxID=3071453 RepID=UPI003D337382